MYFDVYDNLKKCWSEDNFFLSQYGDLFIQKKSLFKNKYRISEVKKNRYVAYRESGCLDKNGDMIFEGNIVQFKTIKDIELRGIVVYVQSRGAFIIFNKLNNRYFYLHSDVTKDIEIIGNVCDNQNYEEV